MNAACWFCRAAATKMVTRTDVKYPDRMCADCAAVAASYAHEDGRPIVIRDLVGDELQADQ